VPDFDVVLMQQDAEERQQFLRPRFILSRVADEDRLFAQGASSA
jgi:hypothetical protein